VDDSTAEFSAPKGNPFGTNVATPQLTWDVTLVGKGVMPMNVGVDNAVAAQAYSIY
jgi:hypothetical protein